MPEHKSTVNRVRIPFDDVVDRAHARVVAAGEQNGWRAALAQLAECNEYVRREVLSRYLLRPSDQ